ncbi:tyrosine-type recombinase/integrase [Pelagicoccus mobilis]|uniref:Core-binding (CB) domain-containing protein n=1 Tax=Pelagicoccus mobilis TaxID=415221 RepID=A0A934VSJ4_9BACT|nr:hypothetical protein [Pelagicoccus mobilis]MBK1880492.1 hypothetical protein [Pelagicoccus mobilis]
MSNSSTTKTQPKEKQRKAYGKFTRQKMKHPSGSVYWRVSGTINGKRYRRNFQDKKEATEEKQRLETKRLAAQVQEKLVVTSLSREQCEEAKLAFKRLEGRKKPLSFYLDYALERYREAEFEINVETAIERYIRHKEIEQSRNMIAAIQLRRIKAQMKKLKLAHGKRLIGEIDAPMVREILDAKWGKKGDQLVSPKTYNNKRGYISTFFKYCVLQDWIVFNPVDKIATYTVKAKRGSADTITAAQAAKLMKELETYSERGERPGFLVPYFALCLFAGIRPDPRIGEISRLKAEHIRLDTGVILIEPEVSKIDEKRSIKIQPNLRLWLEKYPIDEYGLIHRHMEIHRAAIKEKHNLPHNVLRHTFISMTVAAFKSVGDAALQAGNSERIIRKHYLDLKTEAEADAFWRITPEGTELPSNFVKVEGRFEEAKPLESVKEESA